MSPTKREVRRLVALALPIVVVQLGMMGMSLVDTAMVGRLSERALAALGLGNSLGFLCANFGVGVLMVLDPVMAQALGARDEVAVARGVQRGVILAVLVSIPIAAIWYTADVWLRLLGQDPELIPIATSYLRTMIPGLPAFYLFFALRLSLQAMHRLRPIVVTILVANVANALLDYALIWGSYGLPKLGTDGCGWASTLCRWLMFLGVLGFGWPTLGAHLRGPWRDARERAAFVRMLRLGIPIGVQNIIEAAAFAFIAFSMGWLGPTELGGHTIALQYAAFAFMVPVGISSATAVRVGWGVGERDMTAVRRSAAVALISGALVMVGSGIVFLTIPGPLARVFTDVPEILPIATALLPLAGIFQVSDGIQVVASGVLRGIGDARFPMLIQFAGFWLAGIPAGLFLAFELGYGPRGLWWGLVIGLALVSVIFLLRIRSRLRGTIERVAIESEPD